MDKNLLDNMSGQELKEMIDDVIITLEDLDNTALEKILTFETDMLCFGAGDMTTIRRCSELLNKRNDSDVLNKDKIISIIDKVKREHVIIVDEEKTQESKAKVIKRKHIILRKIGLVAAVMAVLMSVTVLVAAALGVNIIEYISKIARQDVGAEMVADDFTFYHNGEAKQYSSIEEMIEKENLDIMYPTKWPEGFKVDRVTMYLSERNTNIIQMITNDSNVCIYVEINSKETNGSHSDCSVYQHNGVTYYIFYDNTVYASCYYNGCHYSIQANNYEDIILIIDNMRK